LFDIDRKNIYYLCADYHVYEKGVVTIVKDGVEKNIHQYIVGTGGTELDPFTKKDKMITTESDEPHNYELRYQFHDKKMWYGFLKGRYLENKWQFKFVSSELHSTGKRQFKQTKSYLNSKSPLKLKSMKSKFKSKLFKMSKLPELDEFPQLPKIDENRSQNVTRSRFNRSRFNKLKFNKHVFKSKSGKSSRR
jgi:hypothetical protein